MTPETIAVISGAVGVLSRFLVSAGLQGRWTALAAVVLSSLTLSIWGYAHNDFTRAATWDYFVAFGLVLTSSAGIFHGAEELSKAAKADGIVGKAMQSFSSTGKG